VLRDVLNDVSDAAGEQWLLLGHLRRDDLPYPEHRRAAHRKTSVRAVKKKKKMNAPTPPHV